MCEVEDREPVLGDDPAAVAEAAHGVGAPVALAGQLGVDRHRGPSGCGGDCSRDPAHSDNVTDRGVRSNLLDHRADVSAA